VDVKLVDVDGFVNFMKFKDFPPAMWTRDDVYSLYLVHLDRSVDPFELARITINELLDLADEHKCNVSEVFNHITMGECLDLIRQRVFTPWVLFRSSKFKHKLINATSEERQIFEQLAPAAFWRHRFQQQPNTIAALSVCIKELNL
jgi:hypothetical protein